MPEINSHRSSIVGHDNNGMVVADDFRIVWEETMGHPLQRTRHDNTAVLMLSWDKDDTDDENVDEEVSRLAGVFHGLYKFKVYSHTLNSKVERPQLTAMGCLTEFLKKEEKPRSLLIVYYAGHGSEAKEGGKIALCGESPAGVQERIATIDWTAVETALEGTPADVLVILDCCHAGLLCRPAHRGPPRCFQYMVACPANARTKVAGPESFTTALTWGLEQLAAKPGFHSSTLLTQIMKAPCFPKSQQPDVYSNRFEPSEEFIYIAPMRPSESEESSSIGKFRDEQQIDLSPKAVLDLRCYFEPPLTSTIVKEFALHLRSAMSKQHIPCSRIRLMDRDSKHAQWAGRKWLDAVNMTRLGAGVDRNKSGERRSERRKNQNQHARDQASSSASVEESPITAQGTSFSEVEPNNGSGVGQSDTNTLTSLSGDEKLSPPQKKAKHSSPVRRSPRNR